MLVCRDIESARSALAAAERPVGVVPTMGALHQGHLSLIEVARRASRTVVTSIFVNPTQFGPSEDFTSYPRDEAGDLRRCELAGVDIVFLPPAEVMYPPGACTSIHVAGLTDGLCGPFRPGHFDGVATVVTKLFNIVRPDAAYFGQKDAQQLAVIRQLTRDLDLPIEIVGCPTVREPDGLAMSSRNAYLTPQQRGQALSLSQALSAARELVLQGQRDATALVQEMRRIIEAAGPAQIDYISVVDPGTLAPLARVDHPALIALAVRIGRTRLIDNLTVDPREAMS